MISGVANGSVTEAGGVNNGTPGTPTATGNLNSTDVDNPNDLWEPIGTPLQSEFGSYTLTAAGVWTYTLDNDNPAVQARNVGQTLTDTFTVTTIDGTQQLVTITINGANDAAVITGPVTGTVLEAGEVNNSNLGTPTATGDLNSFDIDNPNDIWTAVAAGAASASGFGSYALTATGVWTYTLDNSNATVQALNVGQTLTDTFTATTVDGTAAAGDHHHQRQQRYPRGGGRQQRRRSGDRERRQSRQHTVCRRPFGGRQRADQRP